MEKTAQKKWWKIMNLELPFSIIEPETHSFDVVDCVGKTVCCDISREDCEFIVKACNSHNKLLDALKNIIKESEIMDQHDAGLGTLENIAHDAISKAESIS